MLVIIRSVAAPPSGPEPLKLAQCVNQGLGIHASIAIASFHWHVSSKPGVLVKLPSPLIISYVRAKLESLAVQV